MRVPSGVAQPIRQCAINKTGPPATATAFHVSSDAPASGAPSSSSPKHEENRGCVCHPALPSQYDSALSTRPTPCHCHCNCHCISRLFRRSRVRRIPCSSFPKLKENRGCVCHPALPSQYDSALSTRPAPCHCHCNCHCISRLFGRSCVRRTCAVNYTSGWNTIKNR